MNYQHKIFQRMFRACLLAWAFNNDTSKVSNGMGNASSSFCGLGVDTILTCSKIYSKNNSDSTD